MEISEPTLYNRPPKMTSSWLSSEALHVLRSTADRRRKFLHRYTYYHQETISYLNKIIPPDSRVLWIGLDAEVRAGALQRKDLWVIELDANASPPQTGAARQVSTLEDAFEDGPIDYVVLSYTLQLVDDIQGFLEALYQKVTPHTRIVILQYNFLWAPLIRLAQRLGLKTPMPTLNWLNLQDVRTLLSLTDFQVITSGYRCLVPIGIPFLARFINAYLAPLPLFQWACQKTYVVARPLKRQPT